MSTVPFVEPWRMTALRTGAIAVAIGIAAALRARQLAVVLPVTVFALWFSLGGHFVELLFRNQLGPRIGSRPVRTGARLAYWFVGGSVLYAGALATRRLLIGHALGPSPWWAGGVGFVALELLIHLLLRARGRGSFYDGLG